MAENKRLIDIVNIDPTKYIKYSPSDFIGERLTLFSFKWETGAFGSFVQLLVKSPRFNEPITISSGAEAVKDIAEKLEEGKEYNLEFTFRQTGRSFYIE